VIQPSRWFVGYGRETPYFREVIYIRSFFSSIDIGGGMKALFELFLYDIILKEGQRRVV